MTLVCDCLVLYLLNKTQKKAKLKNKQVAKNFKFRYSKYKGFPGDSE